MSRHWIDAGTSEFCVEVCRFTFRFRTVDGVREALAFYRHKTHPSSRLPRPAEISAAAKRDPWGFRGWISRFLNSHHAEVQRWHERVPLRLQKGSKREKVVAALERALRDFERK